MKKLRFGLWYRYALCLMVLFVSVIYGAHPGFAQTAGNSMDAVLVVDVSNSMTQSDKNKVSNEAMKMFVDMTSIQANKIGVISYTDKIEREKALIQVNSEEDKNDIKAFIDSLQKGAYTDISVGVTEAVKILDAGRDPANAPIIVLLADGNNYLNKASGRTQAQSDQDLQKAVKEAKDKGYPIYTIGLNADGQLNRTTLQQIASETNGKFFETSTADRLPQILSEIFANHLKLKVVPVKSFTANGQAQEVPISIPNASVMEANISIMSPKVVEVKLFDPAGKPVAIPSDQVRLSKSSAYTMVKLVKPQQGDWKLQVKGAPKEKIDINLIFNYDLQLEAEPLQATSFKAGDVVPIKAALVSNGQPITSPDLYKQMKATLIVEDKTDNKTSEVALNNTGSGFAGSFTIPADHAYELKIKAEDTSFYRETKPLVVDASQTAGAGTTKPQQPTTTAPGEQSKPFPWLTVVGGAVLLTLLIGAGLYALALWRKANKGFIGQIAIEIVDEDTGDKSNPQYKKLSAFKGKVKLHQLLQLAPEFAETEKVIFLPGRNDTLIIENRSTCRIEKAGRVLDVSRGKELKKNDRIKISLTNVNKSVYVDYIV
ncbi:VWA domain-containing protein [Brevibacillus agri]|uniref:vWA domain-containing protein n=1 Tax=Brevibacillus agri TaxID=51101 RepID=UPI002E1EC7CF|nr:VWA domain-containing protein [Brevibacillus agri]MED1653143.1 VWA domain-containing protein [Brevibacillus agri]MED1686828.1 VWA domain-containing protein [Brevibacillus agri]MED1692181.1 VWA domain-containing protein [Brevibacillus agri]MED1698393.1 VWA domain-containing protein [Brevibacillus agri]